jgi:general secretion pathway protein D
VAEFSDLVVASGVKVEPPQVVLTYDPVHRDVAFLSNALAGVFPNWHFAGAAAHGGGVQSGGGGSAVSAATGSSGGGGAQSGHATQTESVPVRLIGLGPVADRARLLMVLRQLDAPVQALVVHLAVYEVDTDVNTQSAIAFVGKLLGQTAQVGGSVATALSTSGLVGLTVNLGGFSAVAAALDSSNHAHLVTAPVLRTSSGVMASFAVGDSVPTLGSVSYTQGSSTPVQSVQYQQSGVVFSVVPELVGDTVDVALYQSISSFINTTVGVTSSPTLQNRVLSSDIVIRPGSVVVLGGLMQSSDTKTTGGWWLFPRLSRGDDVSRNELILVLSVDVAGP